MLARIPEVLSGPNQRTYEHICYQCQSTIKNTGVTLYCNILPLHSEKKKNHKALGSLDLTA